VCYLDIKIAQLIHHFYKFDIKSECFATKYEYIKNSPATMNCTPFVRQYDIMSNRWGDFNAKGSTKQTIHAGIQEAGRGNHDERKDELQRNGSTI
jgi:hypothetical protein